MTPGFQVLHLACAAYMTGVIWFVQRVQYPMIHFTDGGDNPAQGHQEYVRRMGGVVIPAMLTEAGLQAWILFTAPHPLAWATTVLLIAIWASTFWLQVPCHQSLTHGYDPGQHRKLVNTNWIRTVGWTSRSALLLWELASKLS